MKPSFYKGLLWIYAVFYVLAGVNHFLSTDVYYAIMPKWLPGPRFLIYLSGVVEIILGMVLLFSKTRRFALILIIVMLIVFLPIHIYMIEIAPFQLGKTHITPLIAWLRLLIQFVFMGLAWLLYKNK